MKNYKVVLVLKYRGSKTKIKLAIIQFGEQNSTGDRGFLDHQKKRLCNKKNTVN